VPRRIAAMGFQTADSWIGGATRGGSLRSQQGIRTARRKCAAMLAQVARREDLNGRPEDQHQDDVHERSIAMPRPGTLCLLR